MLILSRKRGEAIVMGVAPFSATARPGPAPTGPVGGGPRGGGETGAAPCAVFAVDPGRSIRVRRGGAGSDRRRDRPPIGTGD
jgi:hypothetical protein